MGGGAGAAGIWQGQPTWQACGGGALNWRFATGGGGEPGYPADEYGPAEDEEAPHEDEGGAGGTVAGNWIGAGGDVEARDEAGSDIVTECTPVCFTEKRSGWCSSPHISSRAA